MTAKVSNNRIIPMDRETDWDRGVNAATACEIAGISYRQIDHWDRTGIYSPSMSESHGSGSRRRYSKQDVRFLCLISRMLQHGISMFRVRTVLEHLREHNVRINDLIVIMDESVVVCESVNWIKDRDFDVAMIFRFKELQP